MFIVDKHTQTPKKQKIKYVELKIYTVGHKKRDTFIFSITQTNIDRFS